MTARGLLRTPDLPPKRAWNTWSADRYLEMSCKPLGIKVTPVVYAASTGKTSVIGPGSNVRLGAHTTDASHVDARLIHAGTSLEWRYAKISTCDLAGGWKATAFGEWGLRFWIILCLSREDGGVWH